MGKSGLFAFAWNRDPLAQLHLWVSQLAGASGVEVERGGNIAERLERLSLHITEANPYALLISGVTLGVAILAQKFAPRLLGFLFALAAGAMLAWYVDAVGHGVAMVGALPNIIWCHR